MRNSMLIVPAFLLVFPASVGAAVCEPAFVNSDQSVVVDGVEIEAGGDATRDFQVGVRNAAGPSGGPPVDPPSDPNGGETCEASIRIARVGAPLGADSPPYVLRAPGNSQIEILPDSGSGGSTDSDVVVANVPPGPQGWAVPFQIGVATEWGLRAGTYVDQLELSLIDREGEVADRSTLTVTIVIPSAVALRLVGAVVGGQGIGPAQVDLGALSSSTETRSEQFGARIFSTAPYFVRFSSVNEGHLLHELGRERVPYRFYFDGALVDLAGPSELPYLDHAPQGGDNRPMSIVVPPVVALAGRYSDRITVTVSAM